MEVERFSYIGNGASFTTQTFIAPIDGLYKIEAWGACGSYPYETKFLNTRKRGGYGGYSFGYVHLKRGSKIYIVVGGCNNSVLDGEYFLMGGGNGGGKSYNFGAGGGATHISVTDRGALSNYDFYRSEILIVAGGGGGGGVNPYDDMLHGIGAEGGGGGGSYGEDGVDCYGSNWWSRGGKGGTQTSSADGIYYDEDSGFGRGGWNQLHGTGGGGGWYGGTSARNNEEGDTRDLTCSGAGGGSGYIGGTPPITYCGTIYSPGTDIGLNRTGSHGWTSISLIKKDFPTIYIGRAPVIGAYIGDRPVKDIKII